MGFCQSITFGSKTWLSITFSYFLPSLSKPPLSPLPFKSPLVNVEVLAEKVIIYVKNGETFPWDLSPYVRLLRRHSSRLVPNSPFSHCVTVKPKLQQVWGEKLSLQWTRKFEWLISRSLLWRLPEIKPHYLHCSEGWRSWWVLVSCATCWTNMQKATLPARPHWQDKALREREAGRGSDSTQITAQASSETGGKPAFPDSGSWDGMMGLMAASRKEWIRKDVMLGWSPCLLRPGGPTWPLTEVHSSPLCPRGSFG